MVYKESDTTEWLTLSVLLFFFQDWRIQGFACLTVHRSHLGPYKMQILTQWGPWFCVSNQPRAMLGLPGWATLWGALIHCFKFRKPGRQMDGLKATRRVRTCTALYPLSAVPGTGTTLLLSHPRQGRRPEPPPLGATRWLQPPPWPGPVVTICVSYFTTGDSSRECRANKPPSTGRIWERSKGEATCPSPSQNPCWHPFFLSNVCATRKDHELEWLAREDPETNPITIKP